MKIGQFRGHNTEQAHNTEWKTNSGRNAGKAGIFAQQSFLGFWVVFFFEGGGGCKIMSSS